MRQHLDGHGPTRQGYKTGFQLNVAPIPTHDSRRRMLLVSPPLLSNPEYVEMRFYPLRFDVAPNYLCARVYYTSWFKCAGRTLGGIIDGAIAKKKPLAKSIRECNEEGVVVTIHITVWNRGVVA